MNNEPKILVNAYNQPSVCPSRVNSSSSFFWQLAPANSLSRRVFQAFVAEQVAQLCHVSILEGGREKFFLQCSGGSLRSF